MAQFDKDIFGKADALLRRHSIAPPADGSETGGVPMLTDLVETPDGHPPLPAHRTQPAPEASEAGEPPEARADLTRQVIDRVMAEVEQRLAADLERKLIEHLTPQVHAAVASAIGDLHQELANAIGDAIAEALERARLK